MSNQDSLPFIFIIELKDSLNQESQEFMAELNGKSKVYLESKQEYLSFKEKLEIFKLRKKPRKQVRLRFSVITKSLNLSNQNNLQQAQNSINNKFTLNNQKNKIFKQILTDSSEKNRNFQNRKQYMLTNNLPLFKEFRSWKQNGKYSKSIGQQSDQAFKANNRLSQLDNKKGHTHHRHTQSSVTTIRHSRSKLAINNQCNILIELNKTFKQNLKYAEYLILKEKQANKYIN